MRLDGWLGSAAVVFLALSTWSTVARADDPASLSPPLNPSEAPVTSEAPVAAAAAAPAAAVEEPVAADPATLATLAPVPPAYEAKATETSHWYGGQILAVDGAALGGGFAVGLASPGTGAALFLGGYVFGGPIVHLAHRRPLAALGSLALRVAAPTLGAMTGWSIVKVSSGGSNEGLWNDAGAGVLAGLGVVLGYAAAIAIDSAAIAREDVAAPPAAAPATGGRRGCRVAADLAAGRGAAGGGLSGRDTTCPDRRSVAGPIDREGRL